MSRRIVCFEREIRMLSNVKSQFIVIGGLRQFKRTTYDYRFSFVLGMKMLHLLHKQLLSERILPLEYPQKLFSIAVTKKNNPAMMRMIPDIFFNI